MNISASLAKKVPDSSDGPWAVSGQIASTLADLLAVKVEDEAQAPTPLLPSRAEMHGVLWEDLAPSAKQFHAIHFGNSE